MLTIALTLPLLSPAQSNEFVCGARTLGSIVAQNDVPICSQGITQSPIDVISGASTEMSPDVLGLDMVYDQSVQVTFDGAKWSVSSVGDSYVMAKGERFNLLQFHMHAPSEHTLDGKFYPAEIHFVHQNPRTSQLLVVGMFFDDDSSMSLNNTLLSALWTATDGASHSIPLSAGPYTTNVESAGYHHYMGSLTAGPCAENLIWVVSKYVAPANLNQICDLHAQQLAIGDSVDFFASTRPVQPLNGRTIKHSVWASMASTAASANTVSNMDSSGATPVTVSVENSNDSDNKDDTSVSSPAPAKDMGLTGGEIAGIVVGGIGAILLTAVLSSCVTFALFKRATEASGGVVAVRPTPDTKL